MTSEFTTFTRTHTMTLYGIREEQPGSRWQALHDVTCDAYHRWYLSEGAAASPISVCVAGCSPRTCPSLSLYGSASWSLPG
jgi:hypothetical protein